MNKLSLVAATALVCPAFAQDSYWIANRASSDIMRVSAWGSVLERVATPTTLRSLTTAPDGKVWIVRFIQATFDIYDPATATFTSVASPLGSPYQIAFDAAGHAWITNGASAVHEFDAAGTFVQTTTLPAASALGITIDSNGNKWIAHRASPASVSKIDAGGVVTNIPITGASSMLPTTILADYRGLGYQSHIWVVGDTGSNLVDIDPVTSNQFVYPMPVGSLGALTFDASGSIWVGSFGATGSLFRVDPATGAVLNTYLSPPSINGLTTDHFGRVLATSRVTFSGVGPPCELRRIDPATGTLESPGQLQFGAFAASGTQSAASSMWQYSLVVAPFGDMDGDGDTNFGEALNGTSPVDPASNSTFRVEQFGSMQNGNTPTFEVKTGLLWIVGFAGSLFPPTSIPGFGGTVKIDLTTLISTTAGFGNTSIPIAIPANPALAGFEFFAQGVTFNGVSFDFQNVTGMKVW